MVLIGFILLIALIGLIIGLIGFIVSLSISIWLKTALISLIIFIFMGFMASIKDS